ncbi:MAG: hypothetical protein IK083_07495, partial [Abditibacteriota bacterium]|nr:hypothetical protein [Abditibacteriota bacterium]
MTAEKDTAVCAGMTAEKGTCQGERRKNSRPAEGRLKEIEWSEDGAGHEKWVKEHFTPKALEARNAYLKGEGSERTRLGRKLDA